MGTRHLQCILFGPLFACNIEDVPALWIGEALPDVFPLVWCGGEGGGGVGDGQRTPVVQHRARGRHRAVWHKPPEPAALKKKKYFIDVMHSIGKYQKGKKARYPDLIGDLYNLEEEIGEKGGMNGTVQEAYKGILSQLLWQGLLSRKLLSIPAAGINHAPSLKSSTESQDSTLHCKKGQRFSRPQQECHFPKLSLAGND